MNLPAPPGASSLLLYAAAGMIVGVLHFSLLRWNTRLFLNARPWAPLLQLLRMSLMLAVLLLFARSGLWPLLLGVLGLQLGRTLVLHRVRST